MSGPKHVARVCPEIIATGILDSEEGVSLGSTVTGSDAPTALRRDLTAGRRLAGQLVGGLLNSMGFLTRGVARVRTGGQVTHIYFHQPTATEFRSCLSWLLKNGYKPVSTAEIIAAQSGERALPELALHVSLDDAYRSNLTQVVPVAQSLDVPITLFVPTEPIERGWFWWTCVEGMARDGGRTVEKLKRLPNDQRLEIVAAAVRNNKPRREAMTLEDLRSIAALPQVTIGSHTVTHPILTQCSDAELERELVESKARLESWIGKRVDAFAYPNGSFGQREVEGVQKAGYAVAFTVEQRHAQPAGENPFRLPRFALQNEGPLIENLCRAVGVWCIPQMRL